MSKKTQKTALPEVSIKDLAEKSLATQRFTSVVVLRQKTGLQRYCAKMVSVTPNTLRFTNVKNKGSVVTVPLKNVISIG